MSERSASWRTALIPFALGSAPLAFLVHRFAFLCDDAFISWRYARNLARGDGLRFNLGVDPPVEGYTNLLWVLWCAVFEGLGLDVAFFARATSVALAFVTLFALVRLVAAFTDRKLAPLAAALFVGLHPSFGTWSTSGMETMAFSACLFLGFERLVADPARPRVALAALCFAAATLLRADGALLVGAAGVGAFLLGASRGERALRRGAVAAVAVCVVVVVAQVAFRVAYHGDALPNTAHAKVSLSSAVAWKRGAMYGAHFLVLFPAVALAPVLGLLRPDGELRRLAIAAAVPFASVYLWYAAAGGDYMSFGRFLVPAIPFAALVFAAGVEAGRWRVPLAAALLAAQILPAFQLSAAPDFVLRGLNFRLQQEYKDQVEAWEGLKKGVERGTQKGEALARFAQPGDSLVAGNVGAQAYFSDVFIHDRHGLVTREVALREVEQGERPAGHAKGVPALWFAPLRPTILALKVARARGAPMDVPAEVAGEYVAVDLPLEGGEVLQLVVRADSHFASRGGGRIKRGGE